MAEKITILDNRDKAELEEQIAAAGSAPSAPVTGGSTVKIVSKTYGLSDFLVSTDTRGNPSVDFGIREVPSNAIIAGVKFKYNGDIVNAVNLYDNVLLGETGVVRIPAQAEYSSADDVYIIAQILSCVDSELHNAYINYGNPISEIIVDYLYFGNDEEADFA